MEKHDPLVDPAPPKPAALIESLRAFGYDAQTAIADLIDNSITAQAKNVWIDFIWKGKASIISMRDDGEGYVEFFQPRIFVIESILGFRSAAG